VTLTGKATDPNNPPRPLTYEWTQTSGPPVTLNNPGTETASFVAPTVDLTTGAAVLEFRLTASNGVDVSATTAVAVYPPMAPGTVVVRDVSSSDGRDQRSVSGINAQAGDVLVAFVAGGGPDSSPQTATVAGGGLTWTLVQRTNTNLGTAEIWTATPATALIDATLSSTLAVYGQHQSFTVMTVAGASGIGAVAGATGLTGPPRVQLVTTRAGSLVFGIGNDWDHAVARGVPAGQSLAHQYLSPVEDTFWVQRLDAAVAAGTAVALENPAPTTDRWNYSAIEIVPR
jgi:hypothetical protein